MDAAAGSAGGERMNDTEMNYQVEMDKLAAGLTESGIPFTYKPLFEGVQIRCRGWDAVCHESSYGNEEGLIEIMGSIVQPDDEDVEGWLTAEEILARLQALEAREDEPS